MVHTVKQLPFTDNFGDFGLYTGAVNENGKPDGKGSMKYENGVYYEGTWTAGCQDEQAAQQYQRIRGGFTSWSGKGKSGTKSGYTMPWNARHGDRYDAQATTNVRGMDWTDLTGASGRYTGEVNAGRLPHGRGVMRYDVGLIAEGDWSHGVLQEGPADRLMGAAAAMNGGQSVAPGMQQIASGMSIGPGAAGAMSDAVSVLGNGGISVAPMGGFGPAMGMMPPPPMHPGINPMMAMANQSLQPASQHAMIAQQNRMMTVGMGSVYGGAGSVYGGGTSTFAGSQMPQAMSHIPQGQQQLSGDNHPPITQINLS